MKLNPNLADIMEKEIIQIAIVLARILLLDFDNSTREAAPTVAIMAMSLALDFFQYYSGSKLSTIAASWNEVSQMIMPLIATSPLYPIQPYYMKV